ncbi:MAG: FkbM family methyltransferase [Chloroflexota bacterium]|nr:MAG: FkbM family methyltransferase [Chloroflexota bacterium]
MTSEATPQIVRNAQRREHIAGIVESFARHPRPFRFGLGRVMLRFGITPPFLLVRREGYVLRFFPTSVTVGLWSNPDAEDTDEDFLRRYLRLGDTVVDVGANVGHLTLTASTMVGESGTVIAIEAHPRIFGYLKANLALNRRTNVVLHNVAIGNEPGQLAFSDVRDDDFNRVGTAGSGLSVPAETLDALAPADSEISLLKVDVEGYEKHVFAGAAGTLRRTRCLYFEVWDAATARFGYGIHDVIGAVKVHGFTVLRLDAGILVTVDDAFTALHAVNLIAVRDVPELCQRTGLRLAESEADQMSSPGLEWEEGLE